jgi:hypothetical protein
MMGDVEGAYDRVGPVLQSGSVANAIVAAIKDLNQDVLVVDRGAYVRVLVPQCCIVTRSAIEKHLGRPFRFPGGVGDCDVGLQRVASAEPGRCGMAIYAGSQFQLSDENCRPSGVLCLNKRHTGISCRRGECQLNTKSLLQNSSVTPARASQESDSSSTFL